MKFHHLLFLAIIFVSCSCQYSQKNTHEIPKSDTELVSEIRSKVAKKMKEEYGLIPSGTGSQMMDKIKMIALSFNYYKPVDIEKARELLLAATNEMIKAVNDDERIHPYLHEFPFTPKNVEIRIFAYKEDRSRLPEKSLSIFSELKGILEYETHDPSKGKLLTTLLEETHQQALRKQSQALGLK